MELDEAKLILDVLLRCEPTYRFSEYEMATAILKKIVVDAESKVEMVWECNECGSQEYGSLISEAEVHDLGCGACGCSEWHLAIMEQESK